jgi:hypothetical protein
MVTTTGVRGSMTTCGVSTRVACGTKPDGATVTKPGGATSTRGATIPGCTGTPKPKPKKAPPRAAAPTRQL